MVYFALHKCFSFMFSSAADLYYIWIFKSESLSTHSGHNGIHLCTCLLFVWFKLELKSIWSLFFCIMWAINIILFFPNSLSSYSTSFLIKKSIFIPMICHISGLPYALDISGPSSLSHLTIHELIPRSSYNYRPFLECLYISGHFSTHYSFPFSE